MKEPTQTDRLAIRNYPKDAVPLMTQKWRDLLFMHWEYDAKAIQNTLPKGLHVDLFKGKAYIAITPFFLKDLAMKMMFPLPGMSDFLEVNVRTYVYDDQGTPGVWFYSLDINSIMAMQAARAFFYLPYFYADMQAQRVSNGSISYRCQRSDSQISAEFVYKGTQEEIKVEADSLEFFLIERYALFVDKGEGELGMARVYHKPYSIYRAELAKWDDHLIELDDLKRPARAPDHIVFSPGVDVDVFNLLTV